MNMLVRTTITVPAPLFEKMRETAYQRKTTISGLMRDTMQKSLRMRPGSTLTKLQGTYTVGGKRTAGNRKDVYETYLRKKMSS